MPLCGWFQNDQTWACMPTALNEGGVIQAGCDVGCWLCVVLDGQLSVIGVHSVGTRWVRPSLAFESRDATGRRAPLVSNIPRRLPLGSTQYELAACYKLVNPTGAEFFEKSICDCAYFYDPDVGWACEGVILPALVPGLRTTCWAFRGVLWPMSLTNGTMMCTGLYMGAGPMPLRFNSGHVGQGAFVRTHRCSSNLGVLCFGHTESSVCDPDPGEEYYNDWHRVWDFCYLTMNVRFAEHPTAPDDFQAAITARNAVMEFIENDAEQGANGLLHLDQLDSARRRGSPAQNFNSQLDYFMRGWDPRAADDPDDWIAWNDLPVVMEFPNSKLASTGHPLIAEYVLMGAYVEMSLVLHRISDYDGLNPDNDGDEVLFPTYPIIRIKLVAEMGMRVRFQDDGTQYLQQTWRDPPEQVPLTILNGYDQPFPLILPADMDRVTYIDEAGRTFTPPALIRWEGHLGFFSDPQTTDRFHYGIWEESDSRVLRYHCKAMAAGLDGMQIPALESHPDNDAGDRKGIWTGHMQIGFNWREEGP